MFWSKGKLNILGGRFIANTASERGGVIHAGEGSSITVAGGFFNANEATNGGAVSVSKNAELLVQRGSFSDNIARTGGGAFFVQEDGHIEVSRRGAIGSARRGCLWPLQKNIDNFSVGSAEYIIFFRWNRLRSSDCADRVYL